MTDPGVTRAKKDSDGDISALCNSGELWSPRSKAAAISDIEGGLHTFHVGSGSSQTNVHVVNDPSGKYLLTTADKGSSNNLDNLPDC